MQISSDCARSRFLPGGDGRGRSCGRFGLQPPDDFQGIYLIVFLNTAQDAVEKIEEHWLEPTGAYRLVQLHTRRLIMNTPVPVDVSFDQLTSI